MVMLPSNVLRLINILEDDDDDSACRNEKELSGENIFLLN